MTVILDTPWLGICLEDPFKSDRDRELHSHPWSSISIVLRGWYVEHMQRRPDHYIEKERGRFSLRWMGVRTKHRVVYTAPGLRVLTIRGPRAKGRHA